MSFENLNLNKVEKILGDFFKEYAGGALGFEFKYDDDGLVAECDLALEGCDDDILASFKFYTGGNAGLDFYFDKLPVNLKTLELVNQFNNNVYYLKARISDKGYLVVSSPIEYTNLDAIEEYVARMMDEFLDDRVQQYLFPLAELTQGD